MMIPAKTVFAKARRGSYAIPALNVSTLEQVRVIIETAAKLKSPVILETSEGESGLMTYHQAAAIVAAWQKRVRIPIILNADHHHSFDRIREAIDAGYSYVHIDASALPYKDNVTLTRLVVAYAHRRGVMVEGELGAIGGSSARHAERARVTKADLTRPEEAALFVKATGVDVLAANIGNIHGLWRGGKPKLSVETVAALKETDAFLTLHGGSGIPDKDVRRAIKAGITKVNVNTELRVAFIGGLRQALQKNPIETTPYKLYPTAMGAMAKVVTQKIRLCGSAGRA